MQEGADEVDQGRKLPLTIGGEIRLLFPQIQQQQLVLYGIEDALDVQERHRVWHAALTVHSAGDAFLQQENLLSRAAALTKTRLPARQPRVRCLSLCVRTARGRVFRGP